jgi:hypothetical protein
MSVIFSTRASQKDDVGRVQFQEFGQVLQSAQLRRTADLGDWLRQYFENRRQSRLQKQANPSMSLHRSVAG